LAFAQQRQSKAMNTGGVASSAPGSNFASKTEHRPHKRLVDRTGRAGIRGSADRELHRLHWGRKGTRALGEALSAAEQKAASLRAELQAYEASAQSLFKSPPIEWVAERLSTVKQVLEAEPTTSALTVRRVLEPVRLIPVAPQVGRSY
jgi:hypothetical protein